MSNNHNRTTIYYIYEITNNLNGKTYIGQRYCPSKLLPEEDIRYMGSGRIIKAAEKKYGIENFSKRILAICHNPKILDLLEIYYIHSYKDEGKAEYNIAGGGQTKCREFMSEEEQQKLNEKLGECIRNSERHKLAMKNPETRRKISEAQKGRVGWNKGIKFSEERKKKMSEQAFQMYATPKGKEIKAKIREARARQVISEETRKKISEANKCKTFSAETRRKISESQKGKVVSEETKQKIREARAKQAPMSEEAKVKFKQSIAEYWKSEAGQKQKKINAELSKINLPSNKGKHWYNNGKINVVADECPEGFVPGKFYTKESITQRSEKYSQWYNNLTEEQRQKRFENMSKARKGKKRGPYSEERRKHIGDGNRGRRYYNNGVIEVMRFEQPDGFVPGRLPSTRDKVSANLRHKH